MGRKPQVGQNFLRDCYRNEKHPPEYVLPDSPAKSLLEPGHLAEHLAQAKAVRDADRIDFVDEQMRRGVKRRPNKAAPATKPTPQDFYQLTLGKGKSIVTVLFTDAPMPRVTFDRFGRGRYMPTGKAPKRAASKGTTQDATGGKMIFKGINF